MTEKILSQAELIDKVIYDKDTGLFRWRHDHEYSKRIKAGDIVSPNGRSMGYRVACINKKRNYQHRLVWLYVYGEWPLKAIDHINGNKEDNRLDNLRLATASENQHNRKHTKSKIGMQGAYKSTKSKSWYSSIMVNKKSIYLGSFKTEQEAANAYLQAKVKLHPFNPTVRNLE